MQRRLTTAIVGRHTMEGALEIQRKYARERMTAWLKESLCNPEFITEPRKLMDILIARCWALYCKEVEAPQRFTTTHGPSWDKHNGELWRFIVQYTDYGILWQPICDRYMELFNAELEKKTRNFQAIDTIMLKEFLKCN